MLDVVRYAGAENVRKLGIMLLGDNFISTELSENSRYAAGQKEIEPGVYQHLFWHQNEIRTNQDHQSRTTAEPHGGKSDVVR